MTPASQFENESSFPARVSILARLGPVVSLCTPLLGEAVCALLLMRVLEAMRHAEAAGIAAVTGGMAEANLTMTIALYFGLFVAFIGSQSLVGAAAVRKSAGNQVRTSRIQILE